MVSDTGATSVRSDDIPIESTLRVWIVDDEARYRDSLGYLIDHTSGMRCDRAFQRGDEAVRALGDMTTAKAPHVVMMDVNMPGEDGIATTRRIKEIAPSLPVIMLTIRDDADTIFEALRAGASGYLLKNAPIDKITAAIREGLGGGMLMPAPVARKVLSFFARPETCQHDYGISEREREVLEKMVDGLTQKEIAAALFISASTVNGHVQHIYEKLHVHSNAAAVAKALRERIV